ncbi:endonuclease/exonuclease/phosphatase family protein [Actinomadura sp. WMMA1423]|uniref:endonuclease/exonuclease/phosphatase family protein n=1 Tax=Actinomadura sp. WMMA1423 TaxID=2591108 RepID=UPI0011479E1A|nr:endonuclease/exonuclease/phosphatase family protein [Actinomadura sp. WMMA1423]
MGLTERAGSDGLLPRDLVGRERASRVFRPAHAFWSLVVVSAAWSIGRLVGADAFGRQAIALAPVFAFTPYAAALAVLMVPWSIALRRWVACGVTLGAVGAFAIALVPRAVVDAAPAASGPPLRILTANMHFGRADPRTLVGLVRRSDADVLSLQEFTARSAAALDRAGLRTVLPFSVAAPIGGALGSALYARFPLQAFPMPDVAVVGQAMPRARMRVPGRAPVEVMAVHLAKPLNLRGAAQWVRGLAAVSGTEPPGTRRILAGDFNGTLDDARLRGLIAAGYVDAADAAGEGWRPTFQRSFWPPITIDHVLVDARCAVLRTAVHRLPGSDHRALFTEVRLP